MFVDCSKWDETKQIITVADDPRGYNVLCLRRTCYIVSGGSCRRVAVCVPPIVLAGRITADTFFDATATRKSELKLTLLSLSPCDGYDVDRSGLVESGEDPDEPIYSSVPEIYRPGP